ncbi:MAG: hypothetical protein IH795_12675 [Bacteroidetes bacterium]|nr:hypothetical protein [Bacteroidota bacterium]
MIDWTLTLLLTVVASITLSIFANLLTDPLKNFLAKKSLISKKKRIDKLSEDVDYINFLANNREELKLYLFKDIFYILKNLILISVFIVFGYYVETYASLPYASTIFKIIILGSTIPLSYNAGYCSGVIKKIRRVQFFNDYKTKQEDKISQLESLITK